MPGQGLKSPGNMMQMYMYAYLYTLLIIYNGVDQHGQRGRILDRL